MVIGVEVGASSGNRVMLCLRPPPLLGREEVADGSMAAAVLSVVGQRRRPAGRWPPARLGRQQSAMGSILCRGCCDGA